MKKLDVIEIKLDENDVAFLLSLISEAAKKIILKQASEGPDENMKMVFDIATSIVVKLVNSSSVEFVNDIPGCVLEPFSNTIIVAKCNQEDRWEDTIDG